MFYVHEEFPQCEKLDPVREHDPDLYIRLCGFWMIAGCDSRLRLADGRTSVSRLAVITGYSVDLCRELADRMVTLRLWRRIETGYQFHDWADVQETKVDVQKRRRKWREAKTKRSPSVGVSEVESIPESDAESTVESNTDSHSDSISESSMDSPNRARARGDGLGRDGSGWTPTELAVMRGYSDRYLAARNTPWMSWAANCKEIQRIAAWACEAARAHGLKETQVTAATLDEFFADETAGSKSFPLPWLAKNPSQYFERHRGIQSRIEANKHKRSDS